MDRNHTPPHPEPEDGRNAGLPLRGQLFSDPATAAVWAAIDSLHPALQHDVLKELQLQLAVKASSPGDLRIEWKTVTPPPQKVMVIEDVVCDRCGATCDVYADRRDAEGNILVGRMKTTGSGRIELEQSPENVPPDFAFASLASNRRLELEGGVEIDAELCAVCTTALIEFIDVGPGPGVRIVPVEIGF